MSQMSTASDVTFMDPYEVLPYEDHYCMMNVWSVYQDTNERKARPTLDELREGKDLSDITSNTCDEDEATTLPSVKEGPKFGWIQGVFVRCLLNIFGVMLFLRMTWITGQAGIGLTSLIVMIASTVTTITTVSMSAICTNGEVKGGGAYYMISRSLGPEFGGAIGIVFSLANAIAAAMYVVGFAETVRDLMWEYGAYLTGDELHEVRIVGCLTTVLLFCIILIGMEWEAKAQLLLLVILLIAIVNYFIGTFIPPTAKAQWKGVTGYSLTTFTENFIPSFRGESFFSVFAIFFPAATGILAGANISGDLKDPQKAIPKGTFLAIWSTTIVYLAITWTCGSVMIRDAVGLDGILQLNDSMNSTTDESSIDIEMITNCGNTTCLRGMLNDNSIVGIVSAFSPLVLAGIFSATLSSALASLVGAPKVFQALGEDELIPFISYFAKGFGKYNEPRRAYALTFFICLVMILIGSLNVIAPIISNFFLMAYTLINYACFDASFANSPGFRPSFKYYNKWISLVGALLCLTIMFLSNWWAALMTFIIVTVLYILIRKHKPDVNWGSSGQAHAYRDALRSSMKLINVDEHVKNYRPQILVLTGFPRNRPALVEFVSAITRKQSMMICGQIFYGDMSYHVKHLRSTAAYMWFKRKGVRSFYNSVAAPNLRAGAQVLMQSQGLGRLRPNTFIMGFKSDWMEDDPLSVFHYFNIIQDAFDLKYGVGILRIAGTFDKQKVSDTNLDYMRHFPGDDSDEDISEDECDETEDTEGDDDDDDDSAEPHDLSIDVESSTCDDDAFKTINNPDDDTEVNDLDLSTRTSSSIDLDENSAQNSKHGVVNLAYIDEKEQKQKDESSVKRRSKTAQILRRILSSVDIEGKISSSSSSPEQHHGTIDVWWLFDDGGLTLLIPYILSRRKEWRNCKMRIFCAGRKRSSIHEDQIRMSNLLSKFRIRYSQITVITGLKKRPKQETYREFQEIIRPWRLQPGESDIDYPWKVSDADLICHKQKTYRNLKLRECLLEYSTKAALIVQTLPVPRINMCPAGLYMSWIEMLSRDLPPTLLLRGNQESVLTYYS